MAQAVIPSTSNVSLAPVTQGMDAGSLTYNPEESRRQNAVTIQLVFSEKTAQLAYKAQLMAKRAFDFGVAGIGLLAISPLLLAIGILIKLDSKGPVLYLSERIGKDYKPFRMFKFRTMRTDADALRDQLRKEQNLEGQLFKMTNDPRITRLGKFLRATSLDELPQLLNVVIGNMSLVGPRPLPPDESSLFEAPYTMRYQVLPGITGMWQVKGRSNAKFDMLCELELTYVLKWSLLEDLRLLFETVPAVLCSRGAY